MALVFHVFGFAVAWCFYEVLELGGPARTAYSNGVVVDDYCSTVFRLGNKKKTMNIKYKSTSLVEAKLVEQ